MTFAWSQTSSRVDEPIAVEMMERFVRHNQTYGVDEHHRIDTARIYAGGKTEPVVGAVMSKLDFPMAVVGTKAHPSQPGGLSPEGIEGQLKASLEAMGDLKIVEEYYLHQPDTAHSLRESLSCLDGLVKKGVIKTVGMSNYHASEVERAFAICKEDNLTPPTVYQGLYNPLNRLVESELLPMLKNNNCAFVAYNPLAAGLLTGKHTSLEEVQNGRFKKNQNYLPRFYTPQNFEAVDLIRKACEMEGISMVEATYRWLLCHSALDASNNDGVLLGASSLSQLDQNLDACAAAGKDPLPQSILDAFDEGWKLTEDGAFPYWRSYSS
eukprot:CAMPEP_0198149356 /NCGR_PEP_ID=MMETSP1443-20131203/46140_1 /TAXON_ID=186043 /ORGANISM="Entomoneis sp., Strain CCMP2396" /LENGTH=323 /DNA_ID=CAMNT_0043814359 /DNA_START=21 /DNA_END=989 /DNA_ORIENTATION=-